MTGCVNPKTIPDPPPAARGSDATSEERRAQLRENQVAQVADRRGDEMQHQGEKTEPGSPSISRRTAALRTRKSSRPFARRTTSTTDSSGPVGDGPAPRAGKSFPAWSRSGSGALGSAAFTRATQRLQKAHSPSKKRSSGCRSVVSESDNSGALISGTASHTPARPQRPLSPGRDRPGHELIEKAGWTMFFT